MKFNTVLTGALLTSAVLAVPAAKHKKKEVSSSSAVSTTTHKTKAKAHKSTSSSKGVHNRNVVTHVVKSTQTITATPSPVIAYGNLGEADPNASFTVASPDSIPASYFETYSESTDTTSTASFSSAVASATPSVDLGYGDDAENNRTQSSNTTISRNGTKSNYSNSTTNVPNYNGTQTNNNGTTYINNGTTYINNTTIINNNTTIINNTTINNYYGENGNETANATGNGAFGILPSGQFNGTNATNATNATEVVVPPKKIAVLVAGGKVQPINSTEVEFTYLFNQSKPLNSTQLYTVGQVANATLGNDSYKGVVVVGADEALEPLGFFTNTLLNTTGKTTVIAPESSTGIALANDTSAINRGVLVVNNKLIYPGDLAPIVDSKADSTIPNSGTSVGLLDSSNIPHWTIDNYVPTRFVENSTIRTNFSNFTNAYPAMENNTLPNVLVVNEEGLTQEVLTDLSEAQAGIKGLVVVSSNIDNSTNVNFTDATIPVVFVKEDGDLSYINKEDVPKGVIPGGSLTSNKAQVLLRVALANDVNTTESLTSIFA